MVCALKDLVIELLSLDDLISIDDSISMDDLFSIDDPVSMDYLVSMTDGTVNREEFFFTAHHV